MRFKGKSSISKYQVSMSSASQKPVETEFRVYRPLASKNSDDPPIFECRTKQGIYKYKVGF
jgi:hypothetical protein